MTSYPGPYKAEIGSENPNFSVSWVGWLKKFISRGCGEGGVLKKSGKYEN